MTKCFDDSYELLFIIIIIINNSNSNWKGYGKVANWCKTEIITEVICKHGHLVYLNGTVKVGGFKMMTGKKNKSC